MSRLLTLHRCNAGGGEAGAAGGALEGAGAILPGATILLCGPSTQVGPALLACQALP